MKNRHTLMALRKTNSQIGASMIEYALLVALIALIAIPSIRMLGTGVRDVFDETTRQMPGESHLCDINHPDFPNC